MIRDDDARVVRLDRIALDAHGAADREEEEFRGRRERRAGGA